MTDFIKKLKIIVTSIYIKRIVHYDLCLSDLRQTNNLVRPFISSHIYNRHSLITSAFKHLAQRGKYKKNCTYFIHEAYKDSEHYKSNVVWYKSKEHFYEEMSNIETPLVLVDMYDIDQKDFRFKLSMNTEVKSIICFSTAGHA